MTKTRPSPSRWIALPLLVSLLVACTSTRPTVPTPEAAPSRSPPPPTESLTPTCTPPTSTLSPIPGTVPPTPDLTGEATLTPAPLVHYSDPVLGFAVDHPAGWEVAAPTERVDPLAQAWSVIEFRTHLYGYGEQAFGSYVVTVAVGDSKGRSVTETVEYSLSPIVPSVRDGIESSCCRTIGGEPAIELLLPWPVGGRWGSCQIVVIHEGRDYWLTFYPHRTLDGVTPSDATARAAFDTFLRTFTFIPVTATATPPRPTVTPVPTPAASPGDGAGGVHATQGTDRDEEGYSDTHCICARIKRPCLIASL